MMTVAEVKLALRTILTLRGLEEDGSEPVHDFGRDVWIVRLHDGMAIDIHGSDIADQVSRDRWNGEDAERAGWGPRRPDHDRG